MSDIEFQELLTSQQPFLEVQAMKIARNNEAADDLVQDTFFKALKNKDGFKVGTNIRAWLYTILKNTFINNYRKDKKRNTFVDATDNQYYLNLGRTSPYTADAPSNEKDIYKAINAIDFDLRTPFMLFFVGHKYEEIAEELKIPIGTVKSRIFKARQKLQSDLASFR